MVMWGRMSVKKYCSNNYKIFKKNIVTIKNIFNLEVLSEKKGDLKTANILHQERIRIMFENRDLIIKGFV